MSRSIRMTALVAGLGLIVFIASGSVPETRLDSAEQEAAESAARARAAKASADARAQATERKKWESIDFKRQSRSEERIRSALDEQTEIEFIDAPLVDAVEFLGDLHNIPIRLDMAALNDEGIARDESITATLSGIALGSALKTMFDPLGLTYIVHADVLKITTEVQALKTFDTRVYNLVLLHDSGMDSAVIADVVRRTIRPGHWSGDAELFEQTKDKSKIIVRDEYGNIHRILDAKTGRVDPHVRLGTLAPLPGCLVVRQSPIVHREIVDLLQQLNRFAGSPIMPRPRDPVPAEILQPPVPIDDPTLPAVDPDGALPGGSAVDPKN